MTSEQDICEAFGFDKIETDYDIAHQTIVLYAQRGGYELSRSIARIVLAESVGGGDLVLRRAWQSMAMQFDREGVPRSVRLGPAVIVNSHVYNFDLFDFTPETAERRGVIRAKRAGFEVEWRLDPGTKLTEQHIAEVDRRLTEMTLVGSGSYGTRAVRIVIDDPNLVLNDRGDLVAAVDAMAEPLRARLAEPPSDYANRLRREFGLPAPPLRADDILESVRQECTKLIPTADSKHTPGSRKPGHKPTPSVPKWAKGKRDRGAKPGGSR